jgi:long-chain acyl-CoA synthetase
MPPTVAELVERVRRTAITELVLTPSHIHTMLAGWTEPEIAFPDVRRLIVSTAFLHHADRLAVIDRLCPRLFLGLGMNEVGYVTIADADALVRAPDKVGRPVTGKEVEKVDEDDRALPAEAIGALRIRGPNVGEGYLNDPEASRRGFRGGWFHPGDLAWRDGEGHLFLAGRADDRINRGGVKIYPVEIERVLRAHPAVADAAAVGLPWHRTGEVPAAAVVLSAPVEIGALMAWSQERLGPSKAPVRIWALDRLPRNAMGKVPPAELRAILIVRAGGVPE